MISTIIAILLLLPFSFVAYVLSEKINIKLQARIGKSPDEIQKWKIYFLDAKNEIKKLKKPDEIFQFLVKTSIVFILDYNIQYLFFVYLVINLLLITYRIRPDLERVDQRIDDDHSATKFLIGCIISQILSLICFVRSGSTSIADIIWSPEYILAIPTFIISGMMMFDERPFGRLFHQKSWLQSFYFYVWCVVASKMFLGRDLVFVDMYFKAIFLFVVFRLVAQFCPRYTKNDLFKLVLNFLMPSAVLLLLAFLVLNGLLRVGVS